MSKVTDGPYPKAIAARISRAIQKHPDPAELTQLFQDIAGLLASPSNGPATKKRKLEDSIEQSTGAAPSSGALGVINAVTAFECKDVSFQVPARKKLRLAIVVGQNDARKQEIRLFNQQNGDLEYSLDASSIDQAFCLPVPEKQQRQWNFVLFPKVGAVTAGGAPAEQVVFTMNETAPTGLTAAAQAASETDTFVTVTERELNRVLYYQGKKVVIPKESEFASSIVQAHRKGEKAYHVKAHRGSKEGYLFFLENGLVFGFKKPIAFFPFSAIESISYTSVLQRTFNLVISTQDAAGNSGKEDEFSMLDQADFAGIDEYVKRHGLNDASMAAARRAKAYNVNKEKKGEANGEASTGTGDEQSELQKAEQELQDAEDEEEEDYEASGGESEGEGEYSSDEDGDEYAEGDAEDEEGAEEVEHEEDLHDE
ncbi:Rtt106-domain-containing protein [Teratosphaeria nubilosa]|uniref:Rtt106-domain-containing protein n=1 Tax=Teratosphaeria nubilosa TaxID=161662 RepID=A0A6G1LEP5_9PEZI|nr:Rtt106-domain-containing protein [Teratosphaeria nubilosa]